MLFIYCDNEGSDYLLNDQIFANKSTVRIELFFTISVYFQDLKCYYGTIYPQLSFVLNKYFVVVATIYIVVKTLFK